MAGWQWLAVHGDGIEPHLDALAQLRITVFREWPYLYEGTQAYEKQYLQSYVGCVDSLALLVFEGSRLIGASTALPFAQAEASLRKPFQDTPDWIAHGLYFGESVVLPAARGQGIGVEFFRQREAHARRLGLDRCCFCAVDRPAQHPARPANYLGNERFWQARGYQALPSRVAQYEWLDIGSTAPSQKPMQFWGKPL